MPDALDIPSQPAPHREPSSQAHTIPARTLARQRLRAEKFARYSLLFFVVFTGVGVHLWLNTPQPPLEASGTNGMKAALNAVPSLSILDGWWIEGWIEGQTGWAIGEKCDQEPNDPDRSTCDVASLYDKLERVILPLYDNDRDGFTDVMRHCIWLYGSFFNTQRMVQQFVVKACMG